MEATSKMATVSSGTWWSTSDSFVVHHWYKQCAMPTDSSAESWVPSGNLLRISFDIHGVPPAMDHNGTLHVIRFTQFLVMFNLDVWISNAASGIHVV